MKMTKQEQEEQRIKAIEYLREIIKPGQRIGTVLVGVSGSGMTRHIKLIVSMSRQEGEEAEPRDISRLVADALGYRYNASKEAVKVGGVGMDMGFHLVHSLGATLFPAFVCIGKGCPSNDHRNEPRKPYRKGTTHSEGGYSLRQYWL